jgi:hypothetical protein
MAKYPFEKTKDGEVAAGKELHHFWLEDVRKLAFVMLDRFGNYSNDLFLYWQKDTQYTAQTTVYYKGHYYYCLANHTSTNANRPGIDETKWQVLSVEETPELMPWCAGTVDKILFIKQDANGIQIDATGTKYIGAGSTTDPRKALCYSGNPPTYDSGLYNTNWGGGLKYFWTPGQNAGRGAVLNHIVGPNGGSNGDVDGYPYDGEGPTVWYNGDWSSAYQITAQTATTITVAYSASRAADFQVGMPIRLADCGTNSGVLRIGSYQVNGGNVVITLADQDDNPVTIDPDEDMGTVNCDFGGDYYACCNYWVWGAADATAGNVVNSPFSLPPRGGKWSKSKNDHWARSYIPNKYHHWDKNGQRYFCREVGDEGSYIQRTLVKTCVVVPMYTLLPMQTDPKEQVPPILFENTGRIHWRYGDKVEIKKEIFTDVATLKPVYSGIERVNKTLSGWNYPYSHDSNYTTHYMPPVAAGDAGELHERIIPYLESTEWHIFSGTDTISHDAPDVIGHHSIRQEFQNYLMWLVSHLEQRIVLQVDSLYKYNFIQRLNCINGTTFTVGDYDIADAKFPAVAPINDPCWGCNGSGFELLLKKIGSYDWWLDTSTPYTPVDVLNYRAKNNTMRMMLVDEFVRDEPMYWRPATIQEWMDDEEISSYPANMVVRYNGNYYKANQAHTNTATFQASNWTQIDITEYRLINSDDWYLPLSKGTWRRTWKYSLGRIPGVIYRSGASDPEGDDYTAGSINGGCSEADYPAGQTSGGWKYIVPPFIWCNTEQGGVWSEFQESSLDSGGVVPYFYAAYPWPVHKTDATLPQKYSTFLKGHYNDETGLYGAYTQEELDDIRYSLRTHSCSITAADGDKLTVDEAVYTNSQVGYCVYVIDSNGDHHETYIRRRERTGEEGSYTYYLYVTDVIENPSTIYYDKDICGRHDAKDIANGVHCFDPVNPQMIIDLRDVFDYLDQVTYPEDLYLNTDCDVISGFDTPNNAVYVSGWPDRLGKESSPGEPIIIAPWFKDTDQAMKEYLQDWEKQWTDTRLNLSFPVAGGDLVLKEWESGKTYNTGDKIIQPLLNGRAYIYKCLKDGVTSNPTADWEQWAVQDYDSEDDKTRDWGYVSILKEFVNENPEGLYPLYIDSVSNEGVITPTEIALAIAQRHISFTRKVYMIDPGDGWSIPPTYGYFMQGGVTTSMQTALAIHYPKMHPKFHGAKIKVTIYACSFYDDMYNQETPLPECKACTLVGKELETVLELCSNYASYDAGLGHYVYQHAVWKKITVEFTVSDDHRWMPIFIKPDYEYYEQTTPSSPIDIKTFKWWGMVYAGIDFSILPLIEQDLLEIPAGMFDRDLTRTLIRPLDPYADHQPPQPDPPVVLLAEFYDTNGRHNKYDIVSPTANNNLYLKCRCTWLEDYEGSAVTYEWRMVKVSDGSTFKTLDSTSTNQVFAKTSGQFDGDTLYDVLLAAGITNIDQLGIQVRGKDSHNNYTQWSAVKALSLPNSILPLLPVFEVEPYIDTQANATKFTVQLAYSTGTGWMINYRAARRDPESYQPIEITDWQADQEFVIEGATDTSNMFMIQAMNFKAGETAVLSNWVTQPVGL